MKESSADNVGESLDERLWFRERGSVVAQVRLIAESIAVDASEKPKINAVARMLFRKGLREFIGGLEK